MIIELTNEDYVGQYFSYKWEGNIVTIKHNMNGAIICQIYDPNNQLIIIDQKIKDENNIQLTFTTEHMPTKTQKYAIVIVSAKSNSGIDIKGDDEWGFEYYAGTVSDVMLFCKSLNIGNGKLSKITDVMVQKYMKLINGNIDSMLSECYFVPIRRYNQMNPDGTIQKVFPGKVRLTALQWTSGLLLQSEFQNLQPNQNEAVNKYIDMARKQIYELTRYNMRIPGLRWKANHISHFAPAQLMPSRDVQRME